MGPGVVFPFVRLAIHPYGLHTRVKAAQYIQVGVVAHMQHLIGRNANRRRGGMEDARVGFADTVDTQECRL